MSKYTVWIDGGCKNNGQQGAKAYFSAAIEDEKGFCLPFTLMGIKTSAHTHELNVEKPTNNVAELWAAIYALEYIERWYTVKKEQRAALPEITLKGDSEYVFGFIEGRNKKAKTNQELVKTLINVADRVRGYVKFERVAREKVVEVLGH